MIATNVTLAAGGELAQSVHPARFERLFVEHYRWVWRTLRRLGVEDALVDDCAQHVFLVASDRLAVIESNKERAFLMGVAVRISANARRTRARKRESSDPDALLQQVAEANPEDLLEWKQRRVKLDQWLDGLTLELRTPFVLFELEGLTLQEIAELLELPVGTVKTRLRKAREIFLAAVEAGAAP